MKFKTTVLFFAKHQIILLLLMVLTSFCLRDGIAGDISPLIIMAVMYQITVLFCSLGSLFSKQSKYEGVLERTVKDASLLIHLLGWGLVIGISIPGVLLIPFPGNIIFYFLLFSLMYSLVLMISTRVGLGIIGAIALATENSVIGKVLQYATAVYFYPAYTMFSRISSLPWYTRKPLGVLLLLGWFFILVCFARVIDA